MTSSKKCPQKAIIFARVSSVNQAEGHSLNAQVVRLQEYCKQNNLEVVNEFRLAESSSPNKRGEFCKLIDFINEQETKVILVCYSTDRLYRSFKELPIIDTLIQKDAVEIHFYKENLMLSKNSSSTDMLRWDMSVLFAKSYIYSLSDNVKRVIQSKLQNGEWIGKAPFGYKNITLENGKKEIIIDEVKSLIVKEIFNLYSTGKSLNLISQKFSLSKNIIDRILKNPFYCGKMYVKKYNKFYPHKYQTIVPQKIFDECQKIIQSKERLIKKV